jgi:predicted TIM-barrel fold metal-dependent hydrolase
MSGESAGGKPVKEEAPLVDSHFHVWRDDLPLIRAAWHRPPTNATTEQLIETLDAHGVLFGVIAAASLYGTYNDYVRAALLKHTRLRATAIADPSMDLYQLEQMKREGFVGIRFVWSVMDETPDINSDGYRRLLRRVADLDWHVHLTERPHRMAATIAAVQQSGAKLVIDHLGHMDTPDGINGEGFKSILAAIERGRTWAKLSGGFRFRPPAAADQYVAALIRVAGGERLVWGSDWPFAAFEDTVTYASTIERLREWVPDAALRRQIGGETALRLYFT